MSLDPYPTEDELQRVAAWEGPDYAALLEYVKGLWNWAEWGWTQEGNEYRLATGGWSGNEDLIGALMENRMFWALCWEQSQRGGLHVFRVREASK